MPELPEVETTLRGIRPHLEGRRIARLIVREARLRQPIPPETAERVADQTCRSLARRGKYLLLGLDRLTAAFGIAPRRSQRSVSDASTQEGRLIMTNVRLCDVTTDDLPRIERWLHADHVRRTWGDPDENMRLLRNGPANHHWRALIEADGRAVGLVLWQHPTRQELDEAGLIDIPETVIDIDIMIGERGEVGKGVGSAAIRLVAERALSDPAVPFVIAAVLVDNLASRRAFAKAGFRNDREFDDVPSGRCVLLLRPRQDGSVADERSESAFPGALLRGRCPDAGS